MAEPVADGEFAFLLDRIAERYLDTDKVLKMIIRNGKVEYEDFETRFVVPLLLTAVVNQTAIMAYLLKKEGHQGIPAEVSVMQKEGGDE